MVNRPLQFVDFITADGKPTTGLVPIRDADIMDLSIDEQAAVFVADSFKHIDFIFFRRFWGMRTLADYIKQKRWDYGEGFISGS